MSSIPPKRARRWPLVLLVSFVLLVALLWDEGREFWEDEVSTYEKLDEAEYVPEYTANNLQDKTKVGMLLFGDSGLGNKAQHEVGQGMWKLCQKRLCSLVLGLGDNFYPDGVTSVDDPQWQTAFEAPYQKFIESKKYDFWMTVGNHDRRSSVDAQLRYTERSPIWKMPAEDYGISKLPDWLHVYVLDTTFISTGADIPSFNSAIEADFSAQLERASSYMCKKPGWRIIASHIPLLSNGKRKGRFRENNVYDALHEFIRECDINMVVSGHEHLQQHVQFERVHHLIQGAAASVRQSSKPLQHEDAVSRYLGNELGFGHLLITAESIDVRFNNSKGKKLYGYKMDLDDKKRRHKKESKR